MSLRRTVPVLLAGAVGATVLLPLTAMSAQAVEQPAPGATAPASAACHPTRANRPVCPAGAPLDKANFLDPTAKVVGAAEVELEGQVYVGPFAELVAKRGTKITLGGETNVQDNVAVHASTPRSDSATAALAQVGLTPTSGVVTGEKVILAHGSSVRGPARLGVLAAGQKAPQPDSGVFVSFGAQVDGAVIERDSGLSALSRVGPGVRLKTGLIVLPGKNVTTQAQAEDPALGKVRPITEADRKFNAGVIEVNVGLAREYSRLAKEKPSAVYGINVDPGGNVFDKRRDAPRVGSALCTGPDAVVPEFRNRIIGDACFEDSLRRLNFAMGSNISIRADEGGPFGIGTIATMGDKVVFHALEGTDLRVGNRVRYGARTIVHGGGRPALDPTTGVSAPTIIGNDVRLDDGAVVFRSLIRNKSRIGARSIVVGSELAVGTRIAPRTVYANDKVFGPVEW